MTSPIDDDSFSDPLSGEVVHYEILPESEDFPAESSDRASELHVKITASFTRRRTAEESVSSAALSLPLFDQRSETLRRPTRDDAADMLRAVHVLPQLGVAAVVGQMLDCCARMTLHAPPRGRVLRVSVNIALLVEELPDDDDDKEEWVDVEELRWFGDDVGFVAASEEAIARLERVRVDGVSEKECVVCLESVSVGSEATRLPCSHHFHGDCIVKWLRISKFCPVCRFEFTS